MTRFWNNLHLKGTVKIERLVNGNLEVFGSNKSKGPKHDSQNQLWSLLEDRGRRNLVLMIITLFRNCKFQPISNVGVILKYFIVIF